VTRAYLSLGSNVEPEIHLRSALAELRATFGAIDVSPAYRTCAVGFDGPDFVNLAVGIETGLDAPTLDAWLHALEDRHGRRRDVPRYSSRTLDVDIALFGNERFEGPGNLRIPRPELREPFVLRPLADIASDAIDPGSGARIGELWNRVQPKPPMTTVALDVAAQGR
jgi:2-amino-4-hydroxy-6-hydroxymethyldihydropteridine diphosphokinase